MAWPNTLRARFALWIVALLLVVLTAFAAFVYLRVAGSMAGVIDMSLELSARQAIAAVDVQGDSISFSDTPPEARDASDDLRERGLTIRIFKPSGQVVQSFGAYRALPSPPGSLAAALERRPTYSTVLDPVGGDAVRIYSAPVEVAGTVVALVQVAQSLGPVGDTLEALLAALLVAVPLLVIGAAFAGYVLAGRALAPIDQIARTAQRISAEDLTARLGIAGADEVGRLAATIDAMLDRLAASFQRERQFTADASHELRTPLAAMQAILEVVRSKRRTPADYEAALDDIAEEAGRLRALVGDLLQLARSDARPPVMHERVDLSTLLTDVVDVLAPLAVAKGLVLDAAVPAGLVVVGSGDDLLRLFVNVVDNAIRYTDAGAITVIAAADEDAITVAISDTGQGIAPAHLPHLFDRFYRADASRTARGSGLGLAIALAIAHRHGGAISVASAEGVGSTFEVRLPRRGGMAGGMMAGAPTSLDSAHPTR